MNNLHKFLVRNWHILSRLLLYRPIRPFIVGFWWIKQQDRMMFNLFHINFLPCKCVNDISLHKLFKPGACLVSYNHLFRQSMRVCVCVRPRITSGMILILNDLLNNSSCYSMALAVDVVNRRGPSNKMHHQLQPKKTEVRLY